MKTIFEVIISCYVVILKYKKEKELLSKLDNYSSQLIKSDRMCYALMRKLIVTRRKARFHKVEVFIYAMRMIMLLYNLEFPGARFLNPIFVSICGLL